MVDQTDNHGLDVGYNKFDSWDYNDEMQAIEEKLVVRDTEANRTNYTPHPNAIFIATDSGAVYDGDGASWNESPREYGALKVKQAPENPTDVVRFDDVSQTVVSASSDYTASENELVLVDASAGAVTVTLPAPEQSKSLGVERTDSSTNTVTISPNGTENVNYGSSEDLVAQGESVDLVSDGTDWFVI